MNVQQIVGLAGNGQLLDNSECLEEFRAYLAQVDPEKLGEYANYCLDSSFTDSGFALQDIVNEIGRRLGFNVQNGRYRGRSGENGFDGLWHSGTVGSFVVETKTTAAYTITLETIARYRDGLAGESIVAPGSPILFVVGRQDTLALEQQIRGSKFAWSMRVVSVEALLKLMAVNLGSVSDEVTDQIHQIFRPIDYTRVDPIVDVVFTTSEDKEDIEEEVPDDEVEDQPIDDAKPKRTVTTNREKINEKRSQIVQRFAAIHAQTLIKRKTALFSNSDGTLRAAISISKRYDSKNQRYWYAYLEPMRAFLKAGDEAYLIWGCQDKDEAYAVPFEKIEAFKDKMNTTPPRDGRKEYWHVFLKDEDGPTNLYLSKTKEEIDLTPYKFSLTQDGA